MQQAKHPRIESRNPNTYFLAIGRFAPQSGQRRAQPQPLSPSVPAARADLYCFDRLALV